MPFTVAVRGTTLPLSLSLSCYDKLVDCVVLYAYTPIYKTITSIITLIIIIYIHTHTLVQKHKPNADDSSRSDASQPLSSTEVRHVDQKQTKSFQ